MPSTEWTTKDKRGTCIMLNKIDDQLFKRRVLRSLEVLVGGRKIETDKQLLQRTLVGIEKVAVNSSLRSLKPKCTVESRAKRDPTSNKLCGRCSHIRRSDAFARNPVNENLLKLNLPDHRYDESSSTCYSSLLLLILKRSSLKSLSVQDDAFQGR
ncbi:hypothetical protein Tco_1531174 [Tanacetum coccineum]